MTRLKMDELLYIRIYTYTYTYMYMHIYISIHIILFYRFREGEITECEGKKKNLYLLFPPSCLHLYTARIY